MSIVAPRRGEALVDRQGRPTSRLAEFLERVAGLGDDVVTATVTGNTITVTNEEYIFVESAADTTIRLPASSNRTIVIKKTSSGGTVTIRPNGSQRIDGVLLKTLTTQYESITLRGDGTTWHVI